MAIRIKESNRQGKRLAIVVPYRDRLEHLEHFVSHMAAYFNRDKQDRNIPYSVHIVEQAGDAPFNRGKIVNCGFFLSYHIADYFCFHDVDFLPVWADYSFNDGATHLIWHGLHTAYQYEDFIGGVTLFSKKAFERVNGYSNCYWGWGDEDEELRERCHIKGLPLIRRQGTYWPLPHEHNGLGADGQRLPLAKQNRMRYDRRIRNLPQLMEEDGLSNLTYKLLDTSTLTFNDQAHPNFFFHRVEIGSPGDD